MHPHIVLDYEERDAVLARERANGCDRSVRLGLAHARDRLVEQQQLRPHRQRARQIDALLDAERQVADRGRRERSKLEGFEQGRRFAPRVGFDPARAAEADNGGGNAINMMAVEAGQHVIEHGLVAKQFHMLERPPDARARK